MLVTDLIDTIEDLLEVTPEKCSKTTTPVGSRTRGSSYTLPWLAKPLRREGRETHQQLAYRRFFSLLVKHGLRYMGQNDGKVSEEELHEALWEYFSEAVDKSQLREVHVEDYDYSESLARKARGHGVAPADVAIRAAVAYVLHDFDLEAYKKMQARGAEAGRKTKHSVEQFLETRHMTVTEAARYLGWSRGTVYAMRSYYANVNLETGEVDE